MLDNYGLILYWDVNNNCYVAQVSAVEFLACSATGRTRTEALEALETEVGEWHTTERQIGRSTPVLENPLGSGRPDTSDALTRTNLPSKAEEAPMSGLSEMKKDLVVVEHRPESPVVSLTGEIGIFNCSDVRGVLRQKIADGERCLIVDLSGLYYTDSSGLGVLFDTLKRMRVVSDNSPA